MISDHCATAADTASTPAVADLMPTALADQTAEAIASAPRMASTSAPTKRLPDTARSLPRLGLGGSRPGGKDEMESAFPAGMGGPNQSQVGPRPHRCLARLFVGVGLRTEHLKHELQLNSNQARIEARNWCRKRLERMVFFTHPGAVAARRDWSKLLITNRLTLRGCGTRFAPRYLCAC